MLQTINIFCVIIQVAICVICGPRVWWYFSCWSVWWHCWLGAWLAGWMAGWVDGWHGWVDGWLGGWLAGCQRARKEPNKLNQKKTTQHPPNMHFKTLVPTPVCGAQAGPWKRIAFHTWSDNIKLQNMNGHCHIHEYGYFQQHDFGNPWVHCHRSPDSISSPIVQADPWRLWQKRHLPLVETLVQSNHRCNVFKLNPSQTTIF